MDTLSRRYSVVRNVVGVMEQVAVPDVVGLPFHVGRDVAEQRGVTLINPDPDGTPISVLAWPGLFYITSQDPVAGSVVDRRAGIAVEITRHGDAEDGAPLPNGPSPLAYSEHAVPSNDYYVDLTQRDGNS